MWWRDGRCVIELLLCALHDLSVVSEIPLFFRDLSGIAHNNPTLVALSETAGEATNCILSCGTGTIIVKTLHVLYLATTSFSPLTMVNPASLLPLGSFVASCVHYQRKKLCDASCIAHSSIFVFDIITYEPKWMLQKGSFKLNQCIVRFSWPLTERDSSKEVSGDTWSRKSHPSPTPHCPPQKLSVNSRKLSAAAIPKVAISKWHWTLNTTRYGTIKHRISATTPVAMLHVQRHFLGRKYEMPS